MLELVDVKYRYKSKNEINGFALNSLSLEFEKGKFYSIFGPSGSGKTTCLMLLGGLDKPTQGCVRLDNKDIAFIGAGNLRRRHISYIFQDFHLFNYMTAMENVLTALKISYPKMKKPEMMKKASDVLLSLGLKEDEINRKVTGLSGGQMQRVAIARALAVGAEYILADEPTGNLDAQNTDIIIQLLREIVDKYNKCVVVVTHSEKVRDASDISYELVDGKLIATYGEDLWRDGKDGI